MRIQTLIGFIILFIGIQLIFGFVNISISFLIAPLIFYVIGSFFYRRRHSFLAYLCWLFAVGILFDQLFGISIFEIAIAFIAIYYGLKFIRRSKVKHHQIESESGEDIKIKKMNVTKHEGNIHQQWVGDVHYTEQPYELKDTTVLLGMGDVRFDLSKAMIQEGETVIVSQIIVGELRVLVPDDLAVSIQASSLVGGVSIDQNKHSGIKSNLIMKSEEYEQAVRRVRLVLTTVIGDVKVKSI